MTNKDSNVGVSEEIYSSKLPIGKVILGVLLAIVLGFAFNFPLSDTIEGKVRVAISSMRGCPIEYDSLDISLLLPKIVLKKVTLPGQCFGKSAKDLKLNSLPISFRGPSFSPFGVRLHTQIKIPRSKTEVNLYPALSFGKMGLTISDSKVDSVLLAKLLGTSAIKGIISINSVIQLEKNALKSGDIKVSSKNLFIQSQTVSGFRIPELNLKELNLMAKARGRELQVKELAIGTGIAPLHARLNGKININQYNISRSRINLKGQIKFSPELIKALPAINLLIDGKENSNGYFKVQIGGTIALPSPRIL